MKQCWQGRGHLVIDRAQNLNIQRQETQSLGWSSGIGKVPLSTEYKVNSTASKGVWFVYHRCASSGFKKEDMIKGLVKEVKGDPDQYGRQTH